MESSSCRFRNLVQDESFSVVVVLALAKKQTLKTAVDKMVLEQIPEIAA